MLALRDWAQAQPEPALAAACDRFVRLSPTGPWRQLRGPTGEADLYAVLPRERVLCLAEQPAALLLQLAAVLATGGRALWPATRADLRERLPAGVRDRIDLVQDWRAPAVAFDAVLHSGGRQARTDLLASLARRPGAVVGVVAADDHAVPLERLVVERSLSINTAAAGGNASLMTIG